MSRFNQHLRGWLGLLDAKVGGLPPTDFAAEMVAQLDARPYIYANMRKFFLIQGPALTGLGFYTDSAGPNQLAVPQNEMWLVERFEIELDGGALAATENVRMGPVVQRRNGGGSSASAAGEVLLLNDPGMPSWTTGDIAVACATGPFFCYPGDVLGVRVNRYAVTTTTMTFKLDFAVLPV